MNVRLLFAGMLLLAVPCAFSQTAPAPPAAPGQNAPMMHGHGDHGDHARHEEHGGPHGMPGGEMHGPFGHSLPEGTWWRSPEIATRIGLTTDQQKHIDDLFLQSRVQLIHMHASLEEEELMLEPLMNANPVDQGKALAQIGKIADTRAELEKTNAKMLLGIRSVLSADQWTKLREGHHGMPHGDGGPRGSHGPQGSHGSQGPRGPMVSPLGPPPGPAPTRE